MDLVGGGSASQSDRDYNIYEVQSRIAYELLPNVSPFIQTSYNVRRYDTREPINRESDGYRIGFGTGFDAGGIITGEVYGGYMRQNFVSSRFDDASGPWFGGSLLWNVTRLTSVEVGLERRVVETTNSEASSYNRTALDVRVEHELLRNLLIGTSAHYYDDRYNGSGLNERYFEAGPRITYLGIGTSTRSFFTHSRVDSNERDREFRSIVCFCRSWRSLVRRWSCISRSPWVPPNFAHVACFIDGPIPKEVLLLPTGGKQPSTRLLLLLC